MVEYLQTTTDCDKLQIENRFTPLVIEFDDDYAISELYETDYDYDSDDYLEDEADIGDEEYQVASHTRQAKWVATYSEICKYSFNCRNGLRCGRKHHEDEEKFFKTNEGNGAIGYKSKPCDRYINRRACMRGKTDTAPMCSYYHSVGEARCYQCKRYGGFVGHAVTECPTLVKLTGYESTILHKDICEFSFCCKKGSACDQAHTEDEKAFFGMNGGTGAHAYKAKPCDHHSKRSCSRGKFEVAPMCAFYHSKEEARCYECGKIGHAVTECDQLPFWGNNTIKT